MSVTSYQLGPNSTALVVDPSTLLSEVMTAFETFITAHGWALWDNTLANRLVFRALNKDTVTYKYMMLDWNTSGFLNVILYESFDNSTHTGTNEVHVHKTANAGLMPVCDLAQTTEFYLFCSARYFAFSANQPNSATIGLHTSSRSFLGVFETSRDHPSDTVAAGFPCSCLIHGDACFVNLANSTTYNENIGGAWIPRTNLGTTHAAQRAILATLYGASVLGNSNTSSRQATTTSAPTVYTNHTKYATSTPTVTALDGQRKGRVFGLKQLQSNVGARLGKLTLKVDSDMFENPLGTDHEFYIIPGGLSSYTARWLLPA